MASQQENCMPIVLSLSCWSALGTADRPFPKEWTRAQMHIKAAIHIRLAIQPRYVRKRDSFVHDPDAGQKGNAATAVLRGLLWQLTAVSPELTRALRKKCDAVLKNTYSSRENLWVNTREVISLARPERLYCVIDGLDVCNESSRRWLAKKFVSLQDDGNINNFRTIIRSRYLVELKNTYQVDLDSSYNEQVEADVKTFVKDKTEELFKRFTFSAMQRNKIQDKLCKGAQGRFFRVGSAMTDLLKQENDNKVMRALERLPTGLFSLYDRMLRDIEPEQRRVSLSVLISVVLACRPLTMKEVAFVANYLCPRPDSSSTEQDFQATIQGCGPLFRTKGETLVLADESARDYVREASFPDGSTLKPQDTHLRFAWACIDALVQDKPRSPLSQHAAEFWPHHARKSDALAAELISHPSRFFETRSNVRIEWWKTYGCRNASSRMLGGHKQKDISRLHMACYVGIKPWAEDILEKCKTQFLPNIIFSQPHTAKRGQSGRTALHWAILGGREPIVKLLLDRQADVNVKDECGRTALHYAAHGSHDRIAKLLLDHKAIVDTGGPDGTALYLAVSRSDEAMAKLLLDYNAYVDTRDRSSTALHLAIRRGHQSMAKLLLVHKANVNARDGDVTALYLATSLGQGAIVKLLLDYKADVNARNVSDHFVVTRSRNDQEVDAVSRVHKKFTHVTATAIKSQPTIAKLISGVTGHYDNRGHVGTRAGPDANVNVRARVNIDTPGSGTAMGSEGVTALHCAALNDHEAIAKLLLDYKIDVDIRNSDGETALHFAAWRGSAAMVKRLINDTHVNARTNNGKTALHFAARHEKIVELLLKRGADTSAKDDRNETALHNAAGWKAEAAVKLLVERGADPRTTDDLGRTMLHHAVDENYIRVSYSQLLSMTELLCSYKVYINAEDREGETVLLKVLQRYQSTGRLSEDEDVNKTKERNQWRSFMSVLLSNGAHFDLNSIKGVEVHQAINEPS